MQNKSFRTAFLLSFSMMFYTAIFAQEYRDAREFTLIGKVDSIAQFYHRIDTAKYSNMPANVKRLLTQSAGLAIAFKTNSSKIYARWTTKSDRGMDNLTLIAQKGLSLYIKRDGKFQFAGVGKAKINTKEHTASLVQHLAEGEKECLLYLPLYEELIALEIGVESGETIGPLKNPFRGKVLIYGSSITQGASASRPGLDYPSIMSRNTGIHFVNLGLSGNAKMEPEVADMIASFNADAYILDCVPNSTAENIVDNTASLVKKIRNRHPTAPIIMVQSIIRETGNFNLEIKKNVEIQNSLFQAEYEKLLKEGVTALTMISSENLLGHDHEATVDGTHPTDVGFQRIIAVIEPIVTPIINAAIEARAAESLPTKE